jgi:hypothetical protein
MAEACMTRSSEEKKNIVRLRNAPQLGELGERLVGTHLSDEKHAVSFVHRNFVDLQVDGVLIDVKARRKLENQHDGLSPIPFRGRRHRPGVVNYIHVIFYANTVVACDDNKVIKRWSWGEISPNKTSIKNIGSSSTIRSDFQSLWGSYRAEIDTWYRSHMQKSAYCFYRGASNGGWGNQPPDNSYPTDKRQNQYQAQIYVQFRLSGEGKPEIEHIIAFPFTELNRLPLGYVAGRVKRKGILRTIDMQKIVEEQKEFVFSSIEDLKGEYFTRFPPKDQ